ncbi:hypothetical protein AWC38_SpisGene17612 [Stylophora pistillata]|uniref:Uncharacterized protein n=1 Tax=Stylophora pistillata TaxID=50429 RepID=A0A2B4RLJ0_STYPI|nr:hypothetical protein AWC38_SpisGene17612 [Stylophora pistillata]
MPLRRKQYNRFAVGKYNKARKSWQEEFAREKDSLSQLSKEVKTLQRKAQRLDDKTNKKLFQDKHSTNSGAGEEKSGFDLTPDEADNNAAKSQEMAKKCEALKASQLRVKNMLTPNSLKVKEQASERGASSWLTVIPLNDPGYDLNKEEFRDALKLRYNWEFSDIPKRCVCGDIFDVDHAMTGRNGEFVILRHNEIRDLEAELLSTVCKDVEIEPPLQQITGEVLNNGTNPSQDARFDILARGF